MPISLVECDDNESWAFVAVNGDVQIGWAVEAGGQWYVEDMDGHRLAGPFPDLETCSEAGKTALAAHAGASNPGW